MKEQIALQEKAASDAARQDAMSEVMGSAGGGDAASAAGGMPSLPMM